MTEIMANQCPICSNDNTCGNLTSKPNEQCWCREEHFSKEILDMIPVEQLGKSCVCKKCLDKYNRMNNLAL